VLDVRTQRLSEGRPVAVPVVRQDALDRDPLGLEPGVSALPEGCCCFLCLVREDLGVGQAGMVIDGVMEIVVAVGPSHELPETRSFDGGLEGEGTLCLVGDLSVIHYLARSDALLRASVRSRYVVLQVIDPDAPHAAASNLNGAQLPGLQQCPDLVRTYIQLFGRLLRGQETALLRFRSHQLILCAG
jgi:hypothetical protein